MSNPDSLLPKITTTKEFQELLEATSEAHELIVRGSLTLIKGYFQLGVQLSTFKSPTGRLGAYGDKVVDSFLAHVNTPENRIKGIRLHKTSIHQAIDLANECANDPKKLESVLDQLEDAGYSRTWTSLRSRQKLLGTGNGRDPKSDSTQSKKVGGKDQQVHNLLSDFEKSKNALDEYLESGIPENKQKEVAGSAAQIALETVQYAEKIEPGIIFDKSEQEPTEEIEAVIVKEIPVDETIEQQLVSFLMIQPCAGCGKDSTGTVPFPDTSPERPYHHKIAICDECKKIYEDNIHSFWSMSRMEIFKWYYNTMIALTGESLEWREQFIKLQGEF